MVFCAVVAPSGANGKSSKGSKGSQGSEDTWTLILHAHPATGGGAATGTSSIPTKWTADALLIGSLKQKQDANYDGKYFADGGQLYLIYSKELSANPHVDGLVAQRLDSPTQVDPAPPVTLLAPSTANGGLASENFFGLGQKIDFKLVETGNIIKVNGKYLLVYSTGSFRRPDYKIGVAWSDTFLPVNGATYRKVMMPDTNGVWGTKGAEEVDYLLQSQMPDWPHYAGATVSAPGVGSLIQSDGSWYLFFAGYDPSEKLSGANHVFNPADRQPYYVPIQMNVPEGTTVAQATDQQMQSWIAPEFTPDQSTGQSTAPRTSTSGTSGSTGNGGEQRPSKRHTHAQAS
jgi:hypothetical protein